MLFWNKGFDFAFLKSEILLYVPSTVIWFRFDRGRPPEKLNLKRSNKIFLNTKMLSVEYYICFRMYNYDKACHQNAELA